MKMFKKVLAIVACLMLVMSCCAMTASADEAKTVVDGVRWFPCDAGRENDPIWEAECFKENCLCQGFDKTPEETGYSNFVDTVYGEDGSLTITRNGNDGDEFYWPRIRTVMLDNYPEMDWTVANTLHYDITASEGTKWNVYVAVNGVTIKLGREMALATGATVEGDFNNSDDDAPSGTFTGSLNIQEALDTIAGTSGDPNAASAMAIRNMGTTFIPQVQIFCIGGNGASVTVNKLLMSTADDVDGANCDFLTMGLIYGDEYYELMNDQDTTAPDNGDAEGGDVEGDTAGDAEGNETEATTKPTEKEEAASDDDAATEGEDATEGDTAEDEEKGSVLPIIIIIVVVVVVAVVVVIVIMKKKNA